MGCVLRISTTAGSWAWFALCLGSLLFVSARAEVRVSVREQNLAAVVQYQCTAGEVVRSFGLDVTVDRGQILGITNFFRGVSTTAAQGYGIFPAAFRDHITVVTGTNVDWDVDAYTPLAVVNDRPGDTLPGLNSSGVTLEFGALWDPTVPGAVPPATGTLCLLRISEAAIVSVAPNVTRGGVVPSSPDITVSPVFTGALVDPLFPAITGVTLTNGTLSVSFVGGELMSATAPNSGWVGTGQTNGIYTEAVGEQASRFFRVRHR